MKTIKNAALMLAALTLITGIVYPLALTGLGMTLFPGAAGGSRIVRNGQAAGSRLIGREFTSDRYFHGRPSACGYNPLRSGGSNLSPSSQALADSVAARRDAFRRDNPDAGSDVPEEMLFASGSGLDPDISGESALLQLPRVCAARHLDSAMAVRVRGSIAGLAGSAESSILPGSRVNTLLLNLVLDSLTGSLR